jgi:hypothetical protein
MAPSGKTTRRLLTFIKPTDAPELSLLSEKLANQLDNDVEGGQGKLSERPSAALRGRLYVVQGDATAANNGIVWWDTGGTWIAVNTVRQAGSNSLVSWGQVTATGVVEAGSGDFTVSHTVTGEYLIKWTTPKGSAKYAVAVSLNNLGVVAATGLATGQFNIITTTVGLAAQDMPFSFVVVSAS